MMNHGNVDVVGFPVLLLVSVNEFTVECWKRTEIRATLFLTLDGNKKEGADTE